MDALDLQYLLIAADIGNFSRAAEALGLKPSTISRRIARFEDELGVTLFERGQFGIRLTGAGRAVLVHVRRALDDLGAIERAGRITGAGMAGQIRLGVRMPPVGEPLRGLLAAWRESHPGVILTISEMNDCEMLAALTDRRLDAALATGFTRWPGVMTHTIFREPLLAAIPSDHRLCSCGTLTWSSLHKETFLTQEWDGSHAAREFFASLLGTSIKFHPHAASKQSMLGLVGAGFGVTLATKSQSEVSVPGVVFRAIAEANAWVSVDLSWMPDSEEAVVGRFLAFMRDYSRSKRLA